MLKIINHVAKDINKLKVINRYSIYEVFLKNLFIRQELKQ
jgi:hypothetical protein